MINQLALLDGCTARVLIQLPTLRHHSQSEFLLKFPLFSHMTSGVLVQSIQGDAPVVPETVEYGISSFVYRARRPFYPQRLSAFMKQFFTLQEEELQDDSSEEGMQSGSDGEGELSACLGSGCLQAGHALNSDKASSMMSAFMMHHWTETKQ